MSRLKEFLIKFPGVCHAPNAKGWGRGNELMFQDELDRINSEFAKTDGVDLHDRLLPLAGFMIADGVDQDAAAFGLDLLKVCSLAHDGRMEEAQEIASELELVADNFPSITELFTVKEALSGQWA